MIRIRFYVLFTLTIVLIFSLKGLIVHAQDRNSELRFIVTLDSLLEKRFYNNYFRLDVQNVQIIQETKDSFEKSYLEFEWVLNYSGDSFPRYITKPSLEASSKNKIVVFVNVNPVSDDKLYYVAIESRPYLDDPFFLDRKENFLKFDINVRQHVGKMRLSFDKIHNYFKSKLPQAYPDISKPICFLSMNVHFHDRGEDYSLDAWTGKLESNTAFAKYVEKK